MAKVDEELAEALRESEQAAPTEDLAVAMPVESRPRKGSRGLLVGLLVVGGALITLVFTTFEGRFSKTVAEVVEHKNELLGRSLKVEGVLEHCTLVRRDQPCEFRFTMAAGSRKLPVRYAACTLPDTVQDLPGMRVDMTVDGTLDPAGFLQATGIMAKCPSKYQQRAKQGERSPYADKAAACAGVEKQ